MAIYNCQGLSIKRERKSSKTSHGLLIQIGKKTVIFKWEKVCRPEIKERYGIKKAKGHNKVMLMKLLWEVTESKNSWATFILAKYSDKRQKCNRYKSSSIYGSLKWVLDDLLDDMRWQVGDGKSISLWKDKWCVMELLCVQDINLVL